MSSPDSPAKSSRLSRFITRPWRVTTHQSSAQSKAKTHPAEPPAAQSLLEAQRLPTPPTTPQWSVTDQSLLVGRTVDSHSSTPKSFHVRDKVAPQEPEVAAPRPSPSPRVQVLVNDLKKLQEERRLNQGLVARRTLSPKQYAELVDYIENRVDDVKLRAFFTDDFRYDYYPWKKKHQLLIRMPRTPLHDQLGAGIAGRIYKGLAYIQYGRKDDSICKMIEKIELSGECKWTFPIGKMVMKKEADGSLKRHGCLYPGLVIEVAYSQEKNELAELAGKYIESSAGEIRTVIGINANDYYFSRRAWKKRGRSIPKGEQKPVTFSIWRAKDSVNKDGVVSTVGDSILDEVFRDSNGNHGPSQGIRLYVKDFVRGSAVGLPEDSENPSFIITSDTLCEIFQNGLNSLEAEEKMDKDVQIVDEDDPNDSDYVEDTVAVEDTKVESPQRPWGNWSFRKRKPFSSKKT